MGTAIRRRRGLCSISWLPFLVLVAAVHAQQVEPGFDAEGSRSFFHWDMNASGFYSARGVSLSGTGSSHWQPTDRIPRNYVGCEYIYTVGDASPLRRIFGPLEFTTVDLNPHVEVDFNPPLANPKTRQDEPTLNADATSVDINSDNGGRRVRLKLVLHDFWLRFAPDGMERTTIRIGHFDIPYGINPIMAPRGGVFVMPPEIDDIGFKKDWGVGWKGPLGQYDYELAATTGTGLGLHSPQWFEDASRRSFALSARLGAPTYWHFQYGLSGLYGKIPTIMADERLNDRAFERWRIGADVFYKWQEHTMFMSQVGYGENGDQLFDTGTGHSKVLAAHVLVDHVPPWFQLVNFKVQAKTVFYDLDQSHSDRTNILFEVAYSLSDPVMLRLDYVHDFRVPASMAAMGMDTDDRIYLTINFYS
ncbi:MAG: hypothetical protein ACHQ9S_22630 [Candidatus Binatia bacterium]